MPTEHLVQGNYGNGWEDVCVEDTELDARAQVRVYNREAPEYLHRYVKRRIPLVDVMCGTCGLNERAAKDHTDAADARHLKYDGAHHPIWYLSDTEDTILLDNS